MLTTENDKTEKMVMGNQNYQSIMLPQQAKRHPSFSQTASDVLRHRKYQRNQLVKWRLRVAGILLVLSVSSVVTMLVNDELILTRVYEVCSTTALVLKVLTTLQTAVLIFSVWVFNYIQLKIFMQLRNIDDISTALHVNKHRAYSILVETVICILHPLPVCMGLGPTPHPEARQNVAIESLESHLNFTSPLDSMKHTSTTGILRLSDADAVLSVLTFLRLYQIGRFIVLQSRIFRTMLSYSLGALAHTKYNFIFIFKSYMARYKGYFLAAIALGFTATSAWCIYICDGDIVRYQDALWVVGITFFTVGYGDYSPISKCSQMISVLTGFFGMFCMGISVSILSRYLQLTFDEYCMLSYYLDSDLEKQKQHAAAQIIIAAWQEYKLRSDKDMYVRLKMKRKLLKALHYKKYVDYKKISSRERRERQVPLYDMKEQMKKLTIRTEHLQGRQSNLTTEMADLQNQVTGIKQKVHTLFRLYT